ncbi:MAG: hypothetical protein ACRD44_02220 [Bryobacteraceae bacterium]
MNLAALLLLAVEPATGPLVVSDRWPECTNLVTWTRDVMRLENLQNASETEQGKALFRWLRLFNRMATGGMIQAYEGERGRERYVTDAHKTMFVYGWGYCDTTSRIAEAAWVQYKNDRVAAERVCVMHDNGGFHTMYRLRLDGRYGAFDPRYGYYLVESDSADARVLDWHEVGVDENILRNRKYRYRSRPFFEFFGLEWERASLIQPVYHTTEADWVKAGRRAEEVFGNRMYVPGTKYHDMDFQLPKGATIERFWDNRARKFYVPAGEHTKREEAFLPSGRFYRVTETMFDGNWVRHDPNYEIARPYLSLVPHSEGYNANVRGGHTIGQSWGRFVYEPEVADLAARSEFDFYVPYIMVDGTIAGESKGPVEFRTLRAKSTRRDEPDVWSDWTTVRPSAGRFESAISVHGVYRFQIRGRFSSMRLETTFENGLMTIPQIFDGRNRIRFQVRDASLLRGPVQIIYRYKTGEGEREHRRTLEPADFRHNAAFYEINAPGLTRCLSLTIKH